MRHPSPPQDAASHLLIDHAVPEFPPRTSGLLSPQLLVPEPLQVCVLVVAATHLFPQYFLDLANRELPRFVLLDGQAFESFDCGLGSALGFQICLQDVDVIAELFEAVALNGFDLLQQFPAVEYRLRVGEGVRGSGRGFAFNKGEFVRANTELFEVGARPHQVDLTAVVADVCDLKD
jgi:hypothetical protein